MIYLNSSRIEQLCAEIGRENLPVLLGLFLDELQEYQTRLTQEKQDLQAQLGEISHVLKSSASSFGADALCDLAIAVDAKIKAGETVASDANRTLFISNIQATIAAYSRLKY